MILLRWPTLTHFRVRSLEWAMGAVLLNIGLVLIQPAATFSDPAFRTMEGWAPESVWAVGCLVVGSARLLALWRNGAWVPSPWIRMATSALSALFWTNLTLGVIASSVLPISLAWLPAFIAADLYGVWTAAQDARLSREARMQKPEAPTAAPSVIDQ